jgi:cyclophilin family peptidyl-prolyl cis-trans isomerase
MRDTVRRIGVAAAASACLAVPSPAQRVVTLDSAAASAWARLLAAHDARAADTAAIDVALASHVAPLRAAAVRVVGLNRIASRYAALRELLRADRDTAVARDAAFALGLASDTLACQPLTAALGSMRAGGAAAWALGELNAHCGPYAPLLTATRAPMVRAALLRAAVKWSVFPDTVVVAAYGTARSSEERWSALYALARARRTAGGALALAAARDTNASLREIAARLLALNVQGAERADAAMARLGHMLRDRSAHVRVAAVRAIASYGAAAVVPLAAVWPRERDTNVRVTMAQSIGSVASPDASIWATWWNADTTHMVRRSLIASAWQAGAIDALQSAVTTPLATDSDARVRIAMVEGAAERSADRFVRDIALRAADDDPRVRAAAVTSLAAASRDARDAAGWVRIEAAARADADPGVRQAVTEARIRTALASDVAFALAMYDRAVADTVSDARAAAVQVIVSAWQRDSAHFDDSSVVALRALLPPRDPQLRQRGNVIAPLRHWAQIDTGRTSTTDYARIVRDVVAPSLAGRHAVLDLATDRGTIRIRLDGVHAPMTSDHLSALARRGYFTMMRFHRVVPAFVAQGGDPRGDGSGGPGYAIRDELHRATYRRGAVGMALAGPDTGGSQFFLTLAAQPHLDGHYTVFGQVVAGQASMDALVQGDALLTMTPRPQ